MATATRLTRDMTDLGLAIAEYRKATPSTGQVHVDRPLEDKKDDPADGELNPDPVEPGLEDGVQDPFDYRNLDEGHMPRGGKRAKKDEDDPGTQDVDPPNQSAVDIAPLDVIVPQDELGKYDPEQPRDDHGRFGPGGAPIHGSGWMTKDGTFIQVAGLYGHNQSAVDNKLGGTDRRTAAYEAIKAGHVRVLARPDAVAVEANRSAAPITLHALERMAYPDDQHVLVDLGWKQNYDGTLAGAKNWLRKLASVNKLDAITKTISGSSPISLNAEGVKLANKLAERIAAKGCLDIMYSSTLPRGVETVQPILEACPNTIYAEATSGLVPWKLGAFEGEEPKVVGKQIAWYIDHPDEVPPGEGNDGEPGESFNASKKRQLGFFKKVMQDWRDDPTMKIGVQVHSRGEDLFVAWVSDGAPDDYDVDTKDVIDPDDQPHASVMRWAGKDRVKEVDLDGDDMLKGGVYLVLHSLTDDDGDDGNPELEKYEGQTRDDNGKFGAGAKLGALQDMHDKLKDHAGRSPNPSHVAEENFQHGVTMLGDKARELAAHPAFNVKINRSGDKARGVILNHVKLGDNMRQSATASDKAWHTDLALSHYHDALLTAGRVLGSKWVGKSAAHVGPARVYMPPIEVHRAAKSAWDAGASVIGITEALADSSGLDLAHVQAVADFFAASESATASPTTRNAYGGVNAAKWAAKVISKAAKEWEPWVGVDLDGTLCLPLESYSGTAIGAPIKPMVAKVKALLAKGVKVRIFTARVADDADGRKAKAVRSWCVDVLGQALPVTNEKDPGMTELWDDRAHNPEEVDKFSPDQPRDDNGRFGTVSFAYEKNGTHHEFTAHDLDVPDSVKAQLSDEQRSQLRSEVARLEVQDNDKGLRATTIHVGGKYRSKGVASELLRRAVSKLGPIRTSGVLSSSGRALLTKLTERGDADNLGDDFKIHFKSGVAKAGSGVMVAFMLDQATAEKLAVPGGEDPKDMHVTLAYLGKPGAVDMSRMPTLGEAIKVYAAQHAPVAGTVDGPVRFSAKPQTEGRDVVVAAFCNPGIQEFRAGLVDAIKAVGVDVPRAFDYRPHVCLKYIAPDEDMPVQRIAPVPVTFGAVTLSIAGVRTSFPLSGTVVKYSPDQPRDDHGRFGSGGDPVGSIVGRRLDRDMSTEGRNDIRDAYRAFYEKQNVKFTDNEEKALSGYTAMDYAGINAGLRGIVDPVSHTRQMGEYNCKTCPSLDSAISKGVMPEDTQLFRGMAMPTATVESLTHPGTVITDKGYVSTSMSPVISSSFGQNVDPRENTRVMFLINAPKGSQGLAAGGRIGNTIEKEVLLPRNSSFRVDKSDKLDWNGNKFHVISVTYLGKAA